ncbi:hypothetical protein [Desulfosudis oleivorans]|uniref:Lipoprotein n=1 Tax=Desulfosudis oleivorans (strain DSM 6200 / JCM 39069 / Hxd3) TaxID=96561 RepID=A8ZSY1_DESOH|nr:hypothetical protein [Desulfosudis oleivorans]ABW66145.1 hypothetical protein Dole_0335 [Desulfosudis oleivorans Hxd3]
MNRLTAQVLLAWAMALLLAGCFTAGPRHKPSPAIQLPGATLCVMPFIKGRHALQSGAPLDLTLTCPVSDLCVTQEDFPEDANRVLTRLAWQAAANRWGEAVTPMHTAADTWAAMDKDPAVDTLLLLARRVGAALNVDYVMAGTVWRFREREGYAASASRPASVAFALYLVDVKQGTGVWSGGFDRTQQPLSENLLNVVGFFKQGAKWLTAEELAAAGMEDVFDALPSE